jgi:hypothetical protein
MIAGLLKFIVKQKILLALLVAIWVLLIIVVALKVFFTLDVSLGVFVFLGLSITIVVFITNIIPYTHHSIWERLLSKYRHFSSRKKVRVYIRNFYPWKDLSKLSLAQINWPFYDFELADILESDQMLILFPSNDFFNYRHASRPFALVLNTEFQNDPDLYQVMVISTVSTADAVEYTFTDGNFPGSGEITIKVYR